MAWMARFSARSPPQLSRCRMVRPLLAGIGLVPPREANAASLRHRPGQVEADDGLGGADRPDAVAAGEAGGDVVDDGQQLGAVAVELVPGLADRQPETADLGVA